MLGQNMLMRRKANDKRKRMTHQLEQLSKSICIDDSPETSLINGESDSFFITYLEDEIKQLNFLESRGNNDTRQTGARGRYQGNQGERQFPPRY